MATGTQEGTEVRAPDPWTACPRAVQLFSVAAVLTEPFRSLVSDSEPPELNSLAAWCGIAQRSAALTTGSLQATAAGTVRTMLRTSQVEVSKSPGMAAHC